MSKLTEDEICNIVEAYKIGFVDGAENAQYLAPLYKAVDKVMHTEDGFPECARRIKRQKKTTAADELHTETN